MEACLTLVCCFSLAPFGHSQLVVFIMLFNEADVKLQNAVAVTAAGHPPAELHDTELTLGDSPIISTVVGDDAHPVPHRADAGQRLERESVSSEANLGGIYRTLLSHSPGSDGKTAPRRQGAGQSAVADKVKQSAHAWHTRPGLQYVYQACMRGSGGDWAHMRGYTKSEPLGLTLIHEKDPVTHQRTAFQTVVYAKQEDLAIETVELLLRSKYNETENSLAHAQFLQLLEFCLRTYFTFDGTIYEQVKGAPMGSTISGFIAEAVLQRQSEDQPTGTEDGPSGSGAGALQVDIAALSETRFSEQSQLEEANAGYIFF
ncbi:hypothetical protein SprV_1002866800 [Sparganum proliferum]